MAAGDNKKQVAELQDLRGKLTHAVKLKDNYLAVELCEKIIALAARAPGLKIIAFLYHKDMGEAQLRLLEYQKALECFEAAREGLIKYRATEKLKYPEDWLNELKVIEKLIHRVKTVHLKDSFYQ